MASKRITSSRSLLLSSSPSPSPSPSPSSAAELIKHSTSTCQKSPLYVLKEQDYQTVLEHIQLRVLRDKFTSFMFPPFFVSIAGALMKPKSAYLALFKARLNSDLVVLSSGGPSNAHCISAVRLVPASQLSLLWRTPWTCATFGRAYASAAESRKREIRVSDEVDDDNDGDAGESSELEDDSDVEDEQRIEDSDDDEEEEDQDPQNQGPAKKKIKTKPPKSKLPDQQGRSLNEQITARTLRLVSDDGQSHRILSRDEALTLAKGNKLDLVLVDGSANPPVCKIYDFNKEEYKQEQLLKERKKQKGAMGRLNEIKELRFNSKIEPKDLKMKVEKAKEFMNRGHRVKFVAIFKGKSDDEKKRIEDEKMIDSIYQMVEDVATIEQGPRVESRQAWMLLRHIKFTKKKPPKPKPQIGAVEQVGSLKQEEQEDQAHSEPDFYQGQEEHIMQAQKHSSISETAAMGRLQGYPSKLAASSTQPFTFGSPHPQVQPVLSQGTVDAFSSQLHPLPLHGFPQHTRSRQGFGASQGSEKTVSPPRGPLPSIPTLQRGVQGANIQSSRPSVSPQPASSLQGFEGEQLQSSPLDGMLPPQSEQRSSHTPKIQMFSMPSQSRGILSQKQFPNDAPRAEKAIGSDVPQGQYPATARRGISPPNQPPHSLYSPTPSTSLRGPPSHFRGSQEENIMQAQKHSSISETAAMGRLQGYPSKLAASSTQPFTFGSPHPQVQPVPSQGTVDAFSPQLHSLPLHGFPQHTRSREGFGASQGSERAVSPPRGPLPSITTSQRGVQGAKIQSSRPSVSPQPASNLQGFEGEQLQSSPLDGMLPPQSEQHSSHTPKIQMFSMPSQSRGILSQMQSPNDAPRAEKAIGSDVPQGQYPATARGRGIPPPNQPPHSLYSPTPSTSLRGPPSNLRGSLLNLSQSPPVPPVTQTGGPSNFSMPSQSRGILSQKQSPNDAPRAEKAIGSDVPQGQYPATARGRISPPNQPPHSLYLPTPSTSLRGPPSNLRGSLLNLSQSPPVPPVTQTGGPSNLQSPLRNTSPSTSVPSSHQDCSSDLESPLAYFFSSSPPSIPQHAPSSFQGSHLDPSRFVPSQNVQERNSPPMQGSEGLPPRGVRRYPPPPSQGIDGFPPPGGLPNSKHKY